MTNLASFDTASYREFAEGYYLTRAEMEWFRAHYLARIEDAQSPYASPLLAPDLHGLPPALVITAECDTLRDEGEAYARRLADAGVEVACTRYGGMIHPFFSLGGVFSSVAARSSRWPPPCAKLVDCSEDSSLQPASTSAT